MVDDALGRVETAPEILEVGVMVEVPSLALLADRFAEEVDFFSIGTNDLTQYTLAAERGNPELAGLADGLHPAVLSLIRTVTRAAEVQGPWVGVCGELGGDPEAIPILLGLGVRELSMNPVAIPRAKQLVRRIDLSDVQALADEVLGMEDAAQVRERAGRYLVELGG
jgi:phosphoenolpyruvate-protein kinase (PTS system EI component)